MSPVKAYIVLCCAVLCACGQPNNTAEEVIVPKTSDTTEALNLTPLSTDKTHEGGIDQSRPIFKSQ